MTAQRIQLRRGTASQWTAANPLLLAGEAGYERDTGSLKIGDGVTRWNSLPYVTGAGGSASSVATLMDVTLAELQAGDVLRWEDGKWRNYSENSLLNGGNF